MNHAFRSTWGALLWKEWRQQRLAALFLCVVSLAGYLDALGASPSLLGRYSPLLALACSALSLHSSIAREVHARFSSRYLL